MKYIIKSCDTDLESVYYAGTESADYANFFWRAFPKDSSQMTLLMARRIVKIDNKHSSWKNYIIPV